MGLLEQEINELRQLNKRLDAGDIKPAQFDVSIALYNQVDKRTKLMLQIITALAAKFGKKAIKELCDAGDINNIFVNNLDVIKPTPKESSKRVKKHVITGKSAEKEIALFIKSLPAPLKITSLTMITADTIQIKETGKIISVDDLNKKLLQEIKDLRSKHAILEECEW